MDEPNTSAGCRVCELVIEREKFCSIIFGANNRRTCSGAADRVAVEWGNWGNGGKGMGQTGGTWHISAHASINHIPAGRSKVQAARKRPGSFIIHELLSVCVCLAAVLAILRIFILTADFWWKNFCKLLCEAHQHTRNLLTKGAALMFAYAHNGVPQDIKLCILCRCSVCLGQPHLLNRPP